MLPTLYDDISKTQEEDNINPLPFQEMHFTAAKPPGFIAD